MISTRLRRLALLTVLAIASLAPIASPASAEFGVAAFDGSTTDDAGAAFTRAGGHPFSLTTKIDFNTRLKPEVFFGTPIEVPWPEEPVRDVLVDVPPGLLGNPTVLPRCTMEQLATMGAGGTGTTLCPAESQLGVVAVRLSHTLAPPTFLLTQQQPLYNMVPPSGAPARFGFVVAGVVVVLDAALRSDGDYGVSVNARNISAGIPVLGTDVTLWGTPADPVHDPQRQCPDIAEPGCPSKAPLSPFLSLPTSCTPAGVGIETRMQTDSWFDPGDFKAASYFTHEAPFYPEPGSPGAQVGIEGCDQVPFDPAVSVQPATHSASSPTGLDVDLTLPTGDDPLTGLVQSHLKKAVVTLPEGMTVNPASAAGLGGCTLAQAKLDSTESPDCPDSSKIGTIAVDTPVLDHQVHGSIFLAAQGDNPFKSLLAMYIVADDPESGVVVKLPGRIETSASGRLVAAFDNQPQLPTFGEAHIELKDGPRAPLITPPTCGTHTATAELSPWARPDTAVSLQSSFQITSGPDGRPCANTDAERPFDPQLSAGSINPLGGARTPFVARISRDDGEQELTGVEVTNPPGFAAVLKGVPYCPEAALGGFPSPAGTGAAQLATPSCPAASQVGTVDTGTGAGRLPFHVAGKAYLAGPYKGAPLSLAFFVPALAGPFDLGTVMVRAAAHVDPTTAQVTVQSDPLPTILEGIPLNVRSVDVAIDRPGFALNPTSCDVMAVKARVTSVQGTVATPQSRYQLLGCGGLGFKPNLKINLRGATKRGKFPALRAVLTPRPGDANLKRAAVVLPSSTFLEQGHIRTICTRVQYAAGAGHGSECPKGSQYGYARAWSPLLDQPLQGPVYLRSSSNKLPDMVLALKGIVDIEAVGRIDSVKLRGTGTGIRSVFASVPDTPLSRVVLNMQGGRKGLIVNSRNLCKGKNRARSNLTGQNGRFSTTRPVVRALKCGKKRKKAKRSSHRRARASTAAG